VHHPLFHRRWAGIAKKAKVKVMAAGHDRVSKKLASNQNGFEFIVQQTSFLCKASQQNFARY
jgi:hypothetical protein